MHTISPPPWRARPFPHERANIVCLVPIIIIVRSSSDRDNNNRHYVIQRIADFAIMLDYHHPASNLARSLCIIIIMIAKQFLACCLIISR
jgi:hypothetical protein